MLLSLNAFKKHVVKLRESLREEKSEYIYRIHLKIYLIELNQIIVFFFKTNQGEANNHLGLPTI